MMCLLWVSNVAALDMLDLTRRGGLDLFFFFQFTFQLHNYVLQTSLTEQAFKYILQECFFPSSSTD